MIEPVRSHRVINAYQRLVASGEIESDPAQVTLAGKLDDLSARLEERRLSRKSSSLGWLFNRSERDRPPPRGMYIHGKVGRGKSMLMDLFYGQSPVRAKRRAHFNDFMSDAHDRIHAHRQAFARGETQEQDPIRPVGRALAREARLLCFDEFAVTDIADAMILGRLFAVLFAQGTVVVATSNVAPGALYQDGLNRQLFLPFIALLDQHCEVFELDAGVDFRLAKLGNGRAYLSPLSAKADARMAALWRSVADGHAPETGEIDLKGRTIRPEHAAGDAAWFSFEELCVKPRGARDFLAVVGRFDTVFVSGVPIMDRTMRNEAKRFILLIDTLYDRHVRTVISAAANPHALYMGGSGNEAFEFQRTASRLIEMQSEQYQTQFGNRRSGVSRRA